MCKTAVITTTLQVLIIEAKCISSCYFLLYCTRAYYRQGFIQSQDLWCNRLALRTLNPVIRVQDSSPVGPRYNHLLARP